MVTKMPGEVAHLGDGLPVFPSTVSMTRQWCQAIAAPPAIQRNPRGGCAFIHLTTSISYSLKACICSAFNFPELI